MLVGLRLAGDAAGERRRSFVVLVVSACGRNVIVSVMRVRRPVGRGTGDGKLHRQRGAV